MVHRVKLPNRTVSAARSVSLAVALVVLATAPAASQAYEPTRMQRFFGALGLLEIPDDPIEYRQRAPLVVPPNAALINPRNPDDIARINPDWPVDHDNQTRREADAEDVRRVDEQFYSGRVLRADELRGKRGSPRQAAGTPSQSTAGEDHARGHDRLLPDQLGFRGLFGGKSAEKTAVFTGEPVRTRLTEPPAGYRTPSPKAPYGVVSQKREKAKPLTFFDRTGADEDPARRR